MSRVGVGPGVGARLGKIDGGRGGTGGISSEIELVVETRAAEYEEDRERVRVWEIGETGGEEMEELSSREL